MRRACLAIGLLLASLSAFATDKGKVLLYGGAGQGRVVFDGRTHAAKGMVCKDCHPLLFATRKVALISMADHSGNTRCFACHNGTKAFNGCADCHRDLSAAPAPKPTLTYEGATTIGKGIMPEAAKLFEKKTGVAFSFIGEAGADPGFKAAVAGKVTFGGVARELTEAERTQVAVAQVIGFDVMGVFVHPGNPIRMLTKAQLKAIFSGQATNWKQVGGADRPITIYSEKLAGGRATVKAFRDMVLGKEAYGGTIREFDDAPDCLRDLAKDPGGVAASSMSFSTPEVAALAVDGAQPTAIEAQAGHYPLKRPLILVSKDAPRGPAKDFLEFVLTSEAQAIVGRKFVPAK